MLVLAVTVVCLVPFAGKAFHVDDTLFLWCARQIQQHPGDFYGFDANWYGYAMPMHQINQNPPLVPYYIAAVARLFGWHEVTLHLAFLLPAIGVSLGMYYLARSLCSRPRLAALIGILSPAFLVSSTSIMTDVTMVALYVWAVVLWLHGIKSDRSIYLLFSAILVSLSMMAKYYGVTAAGLLFAYSVAVKRRPGLWVVFLAIPIAVLGGYELLCHRLYGSGLFGNAVSYASGMSVSGVSPLLRKPLVGLSFTGGCMLGLLFYSRALLSRRWFLVGGLSAAVIAVLLEATGLGSTLMADQENMPWYVSIQLAILVTTGAGVLVLALSDLWASRDASSLLLALWVVGTFVFSTFVNWTINTRTILPMVPAVGILVARRLDKMHPKRSQVKGVECLVPVIAAAILSLAVVWADATYANCQRSAARVICNQYAGGSRTIWFDAHWGFQYYMELLGARAVDYADSTMQRGDAFVTPVNNCNMVPPDGSRRAMEAFELVECKELTACRWLTTVSRPLGAGFYDGFWGCMPFCFGPVPPEEYPIAIVATTTPLLIWD